MENLIKHQKVSKYYESGCSYLAVQGSFKRNREGKYLDGSGENEKRTRKIRIKKEET